MAEFSSLSYRGTLKGHSGWVTAIATTAESPDMILSASRDKSIIVWSLTRDEFDNFGVPRKSLHGHNSVVQDVVISSDGQFALSASWDKTLRLWDLNTGVTTRRFVGHTNDVLSVSFSADNRQIVSGSRDKTIKLWNTLGECKFNIQEDGHSEWSLAFDSLLTLPTHSLCLVDGTKLSKFGNLPSANFALTTLDTLVILTLLQFHQMVLFALQVVRMVLLCFGILTRASTCIHWKERVMTSSML